MELFTPDVGLIFWQVVVFLMLFLLLAKFAWKPITSSLRDREDFIADSLKKAEEARVLLEQTEQERRTLLQKAREEREASFKQAQEAIARMQEEAQQKARRTGEEMIAAARTSIEKEKEAAMQAVRDQVVVLSVQVAEKILRAQLSGSETQKKLLVRYLDDLPKN